MSCWSRGPLGRQLQQAHLRVAVRSRRGAGESLASAAATTVGVDTRRDGPRSACHAAVLPRLRAP